MNCKNCGVKLSENEKICSNCGNEVEENTIIDDGNISRLGYSSRISDPAFAKYVKNANKYTLIISIIIGVCIIIGFYIIGNRRIAGMSNPLSFILGIIMGLLLIILALAQVIGRKRSKTWDGIVEDKKVKQKKERNQDFTSKYLEYLIIIRDNDRKKHIYKFKNNEHLYNYFNIGDKVRHHARLNSYEKYDKTNDSIIPCNACGNICDMNDEYCNRCKCPLLK